MSEQPDVVTDVPEPQAAPGLEPTHPDVFDWHTPEGQPGYSWTEMKQLASTMAESSLVPAVYRKKPQNVVALAITGQELGWGVGTAMRFIHIIDGKPSISPEGMLALIRRAGHSVGGSSSSKSATVRGKRRDNGDEMECTFTMDDAVRAKLAGKDNWKLWPDAMLWARALAMLARRLFPDVLLGVAYVPDEMGANTDQWGNAIETTGRDDDDGLPTWEALHWDGSDHYDAAMRDTKRLMNLLDEDTKAKVRGLLGPPPPINQYSLNVWAMRHAIVVAAARETEVIGPDDETTPNLVAFDGANRAEGEGRPVPAPSPSAPTPPATDPAPGADADDDAADREWVQQALASDDTTTTVTVDDDDADDADDGDGLDAADRAEMEFGDGGYYG